MHPNNLFRTEDRALMETLVVEIGFGMIFAATPNGPRVAHAPLLWTGDGAMQFHLSRGNALARHLDGTTALAVVNGPDAYISPRWYDSDAEVPTWNYVTVEMEGRVRRVDEDGLSGMLEALSSHHEARVQEGQPWTIDKTPPGKLAQLKAGIFGFELEVQAWRPTFKLSQNKSAEERERIAIGLERQGSPAIARLMRDITA